MYGKVFGLCYAKFFFFFFFFQRAKDSIVCINSLLIIRFAGNVRLYFLGQKEIIMLSDPLCFSPVLHNMKHLFVLYLGNMACLCF